MNAPSTTFTNGTAIAISVNRKFTGKQQDDRRWEKHTTSFAIEVLDVAGIVDAIKSGYAIAAAHHTRRHSDNFISAQHIGLDFDTETDASTIENVLKLPLASEHAAILHETSSHKPDKPRCRVLFILDEPVRDAKTYARYAAALVWQHSLVDRKCTDAARLWFGATNCHAVVRPDKILPVSLLDDLAKQHAAHLAEQERLQDVDLSIDPHEAVKRAIELSSDGRHHAGFWLACRLRDSGLTHADAIPHMLIYQQTVQHSKDHEYPQSEALHSLKGAYTRPPRGHSEEQLEKDLTIFEWFAWNENVGTKQGATHYSLQSIMHVSNVARKCRRTQGLDLPLRDFMQEGVKKDTARGHLAAMVEANLLTLDRKSDTRRATKYSVNLPYLRHLAQQYRDADKAQSFDIAQSQTYRGIAHLAYFVEGARIDARLWTSEPPAETFGAACQRLIAVLAMSENLTGEGCHEQTIKGQGHDACHDCLSVTPVVISSKNKLFDVANVSERVGQRKLKLLESLGIVVCETGDRGAKLPTLVENWYERMVEIEPALTTFGHNLIMQERYDNQRESYHGKMRDYIHRDEDVELCENAAQRATERNSDRQREKRALMERRFTWAKRHGITNVPELGDTGKPPRKKIEQPVVDVTTVTDKRTGQQKRKFITRKLIPSTAKTTKNRMTPTEQRKRLDLLIAKPALWANELDEVKTLSTALNVKVRVTRTEFGASL